MFITRTHQANLRINYVLRSIEDNVIRNVNGLDILLATNLYVCINPLDHFNVTTTVKSFGIST